MGCGKALHETIEPGQVERAVLHADVDVIGPGGGGRPAGLERQFGAGVAAGVEDRTAVGESRDRAVPVRHGALIA